MPDVTITGLPNAAVPLSGTERVPMDQSGVTRDATAQDIANLSAAAIAAAVAAHAGAADPHPIYLPSDVTGIPGAIALVNIVHMSQAAYDALVTRDPNTLYITPAA